MRIVFKVGSAVLSEGDTLAHERIEKLVELIVKLSAEHEVIMVSSGAVMAGFTELQLDRSDISNRQALTAIGQPYMMSVYQQAFAHYEKKCAQMLLTKDDFNSRKQTKSAEQAISVLLKNGIVPIINENDITAVDELVFGDNDQLSANAAHYFNADLLVILSDIEVYYKEDPMMNDNAKAIKHVHEVTDEDLENDYNLNDLHSTGGISTKLRAGKFLLENNRQMFLASGFDLSDTYSYLIDGDHIGGTLFSNIKKIEV